MDKEKRFFRQHPYELVEHLQEQSRNAHIYSMEEKLAAIDSAMQEDQIIIGSVGWGIQTGISLDTVLRFSRDIDIAGYSQNSSLDSGRIIVSHWQDRIRLIRVLYEHQEYSLLVAHYLDIALTTCFFLQEQPLAVVEQFQALKVLKWVVALVHIYLYSLNENPNKKWDQEARAYISQTLNQLQKQLSCKTFAGDELISAKQLRTDTDNAFAKLMKFLPAV